MEYKGIERRDSIGPVLRLGQILAEVRRTRASGAVELVAQGQSYGLEIARGTICLVRGPGLSASCDERAGTIVLRLAQDLFRLPRPLVAWRPVHQGPSCGHVDPEAVVLSGLVARRDLFDPVALAERIPATVLRLTSAEQQRLRHLPLHPEERSFLSSLDIPTPVTLVLWKRGLAPAHAAALLTALNLLGAFAGQWEPADLPRCGSVRRLSAALNSRLPDHELFNLDLEADEADVDAAFRRIATQLHPDRRWELPEADRREAAEVLARVSEAYGRLKSTRRRRKVVRGAPIGKVTLVQRPATAWEPLWREAQSAAVAGASERARAYALKAMSCHPPEYIRQQLLGILAA